MPGDRERLLTRIAARHADLPRRVIAGMAAGRPAPVEDLAQTVWLRFTAEPGDLPTDEGDQRAYLFTLARQTYLSWQKYKLAKKRDERVTDSISELAERRTRGEPAGDSDDAVIGLVGIGSTVEQVVLLREQLAVVRAAVALMTPSLRLGLAHALGWSHGRPDHARAARRRLAEALAVAGYAAREGEPTW